VPIYACAEQGHIHAELWLFAGEKDTDSLSTMSSLLQLGQDRAT